MNSYQPETADSSEKLPNNNNNKKEKPFSIIFTSVDQTVHYSVICYESNKFSEIIKELFDEYPILKTKKVCYLCEGRIIDENKTLQENKLSHNSNIIINYLD